MNKSSLTINDLELSEDFGLFFRKKIVLYGAGFRGMEVFRRLEGAGIAVSYFCDTYKCSNHTINGIKILSPIELKQLDEKEDILVIITTIISSFFNEVIETISSLNLRTRNIYSKIALDISLTQNVNDPRLNVNYYAIASFTREMKKFLRTNMENKLFFDSTIYILESLDSILVYQYGKAGSSTIASSLFEIGIPHVHIHDLNNSGFSLNKLSVDVSESKHLEHCLNSFKDLLTRRKIIKIITQVRDPISRDYSYMFQCAESHDIYSVMQLGHSFVSDCNEWFKKRVVKDEASLFDWFDLEIKNLFGVDVFEYPFDKEKGFSIIKQDNIEILLIKMEKLNDLEQVIGEFVNAPNFKLVNANIGGKKYYSYLYNQIKDVIQIPREYISRYYIGNSRMDHFYTDEEKAAFLKKWEKNFID